jgi:hypothetical protein
MLKQNQKEEKTKKEGIKKESEREKKILVTKSIQSPKSSTISTHLKPSH